MKPFVCMLACAALPAVLSAAEPAMSVVARAMDRDLSGIEREFVPLVEAMPAGKMDFAPTAGEFKGVRTFGQQAKHVAAVLYIVSSAVLEQPVPKEAGEGEDGPADVQSKEQIVQYVKGAFAYGHKAMTSLTDAKAQDMVKSAFGNNKVPRLSMATLATSHSFDHYGQMVVYLRMNGIVPPASRR